jgi:fructokinase
MTADFRRATGRELAPAAIEAAADDGEPQAEAAMGRYEHRLARSLASVINIVDPDVVVLGGGLSNLRRIYRRVPRLIGSYLFSDGAILDLRPPLHGDSGGVRGAAWLGATGDGGQKQEDAIR